MANDSDLITSKAIPDEIKQWNWGAFFLSPIWGVWNRVYFGLLVFIPVFGFAVPIILGIKGNEWAWKKRSLESPKAFLLSQQKWSHWGWGVTILAFLSLIVLTGYIEGLAILLLTLLVITFFDNVFRRAGYRYAGGMSLLMLVVPANLVMLLIFAYREWPIERQIRDLKILCGNANEEDAYSLIDEAVRLEAKGNFEAALVKYEEVVKEFKHTEAGNDAEKCIEALQAKLGEWEKEKA